MCVDRYGPKLGIIVGGMVNVCVLSLYWFIATGRLWQLQSDDQNMTTWLIFVLSILGVLSFMGCALITGSVFKLIVESCGKGSKGKAVGCAKGYVGVGSGVYVCLFGALFGMSTSSGGVGPAQTSLMSTLPSNVWWTTTPTFRHHAFTTFLMLQGKSPPNPEIMNTLNFLLMAACLSFIAAVLPAIIFLPNHQRMQSKKPRDGTRSVHFRVVYAGLLLLGIWVVGTSLVELHEEENKAAASASAKGLPSSIVNKTIHHLTNSLKGNQVDNGLLEELTHDEHSRNIGNDGQITLPEKSSEPQNSNYDFHAGDEQTPKPVTVWKRIRRLSTTISERHWGAAALLLILWWGPALSLLIIPARSISSSSYATIEQEDMCHDEISLDATNGDTRERDSFLNDNPNRRSMSLAKNSNGATNSPAPTQKEYTLAEMLKTGKAWLMAYTFIVLVGGGTLMTCNIGENKNSLSLFSINFNSHTFYF